MITRWAPQGITWPVLCICGRRCIVRRHGLWRHVAFLERRGSRGWGWRGNIWVTVRIMCACVVSWERTLDWLSHLLLPLDISPLTRALTNTYIHMCILLGDTLGTSGSACQKFPFISCDLLTPGSHRRQTGISVTSCHCCKATIGGSLPYRSVQGRVNSWWFSYSWLLDCFDSSVVSPPTSLLITSRLLTCICLLWLSSPRLSLSLWVHPFLSLFLFRLPYSLRSHFSLPKAAGY